MRSPRFLAGSWLWKLTKAYPRFEDIFKFKGIIQFSDAQSNSFSIDIPKTGEPRSAEEEAKAAAAVDESSTGFFFEEEGYQLNRMSGVRLSLCLSLRILYILSV